MKNAILAPVFLAISAFGLAGCQQESAPMDAAPEGIPGVTASNGRLVLPAVEGNPGAVYFDIINEGDEFATIRAVDVAGAQSAQLHESVEVSGQMTMGELGPVRLDKGEPVAFEPGGKHVMAMKLDPGLKPGESTDVTITFVGGDKLTFPATIEPAGGAD